jgi:succinate-semialdehyde dehydrogenase/glutarate-semialdehyde dehydrogenase
MNNKKQTLAELITTEMGKPIKESIAEVEKSISMIDYYAQNA